MIDSHCHLDHEPLLENLDEVIKRSKEVGITKLLTICTTLDSFNRIKEISKKIYNKDIKIQGLLNERNYLESKMYQNKAKVHQLTMIIMNLDNF